MSHYWGLNFMNSQLVVDNALFLSFYGSYICRVYSLSLRVKGFHLCCVLSTYSNLVPPIVCRVVVCLFTHSSPNLPLVCRVPPSCSWCAEIMACWTRVVTGARATRSCTPPPRSWPATTWRGGQGRKISSTSIPGHSNQIFRGNKCGCTSKHWFSCHVSGHLILDKRFGSHTWGGLYSCLWFYLYCTSLKFCPPHW